MESVEEDNFQPGSHITKESCGTWEVEAGGAGRKGDITSSKWAISSVGLVQVARVG